MLLDAMRVWNEFMFALTFIIDDKLKTVPLGLMTFSGALREEWTVVMAGSDHLGPADDHSVPDHPRSSSFAVWPRVASKDNSFPPSSRRPASIPCGAPYLTMNFISDPRQNHLLFFILRFPHPDIICLQPEVR